jgi:hypothetical protein
MGGCAFTAIKEGSRHRLDRFQSISNGSKTRFVDAPRRARSVSAPLAVLAGRRPQGRIPANSVVGHFYPEGMYMGTVLMAVADQAFGTEVFVADADVVLGDACDVLASGRRSELLRALDAGTAIAFMSEHAFHEVGWMSAKSARGRGVDHDALRALIADAYLPRIPVVVTQGAHAEHWMPDASDVADPDDVAHVQVARLISARAVYSHDRHLRGPRLAPATRADYDQRVVHLSVLSTRREAERGVGLVVGFAGTGTAEAVSWTSLRLSVKPAMVWFALVVASAASAYLVLAPPQRRLRIAAALEPVIGRVGAAFERSESARRELSAARLITAPDSHRLETQVATYLSRNPDSNMGEIAEALELNSAGRRRLSVLLRLHPSFQLASGYGWAIGSIRSRLETQPSPSWHSRPKDTRTQEP